MYGSDDVDGRLKARGAQNVETQAPLSLLRREDAGLLGTEKQRRSATLCLGDVDFLLAYYSRKLAYFEETLKTSGD